MGLSTNVTVGIILEASIHGDLGKHFIYPFLKLLVRIEYLTPLGPNCGSRPDAEA